MDYKFFCVLGLVIALQGVLHVRPIDAQCQLDNCVECVKKVKEYGAGQIGASLMPGHNPSKYIAGNQCWDCDSLQKVCQHATGARRKRQAYNFTSDPRRQWSSPISYMFNSSIPSSNSIGFDAKGVIRDALSYIQAQTCIRFTEVQQPLSTSYISFGLGPSCVSFVGRTLGTISGPIFATTSCLTEFGQMLYLIAQTLGLFHESQRYDRDNYITILTQNVLPENLGDLGLLDQSLQLLNTFGLPYDYASLMQFPSKIFTSNGDYTVITKDPLYLRTIGQRVQLSFQDTKLLNLMYCQGVCASQALASPCQNGGYQNPNNCNVCHCPDGYSGTYCTELERAQGANCGGELSVMTTEQIITSPGYTSPGYYDPQVKCIWRLNAPSGSRMRLRFIGDFGIYCNDESCYHWVEVRYTGLLNNTGPRFCCNNLPADLITTGNQAMIIFQSNLSGIVSSSQRGFQLAFSIWSSSVVSASGPCDSNPCHNNGTCSVNSSSSTGFTCQCPTGLSGPLCQHGCCGGCDAKPGKKQALCIVNEYPVRMCNVTGIYGSTSSSSYAGGGWSSRHKRHMPRYRVTQVPCTVQFCCDNAHLVGIPGLSASCAVTGWTDWSGCSAACGGGFQVQYLYDIRQQYNVNGQSYNISFISNSTTVACNTQPCSCPSSSSIWSLFGRWRSRNCSPCNFGFTKQGNSCQLS